MEFEEIVKKIEEKTGLKREDILKKIDLKCKELSGLITKEGAAFIIAKELGLEIPSIHKSYLEIKNLVSGMRNVSIVGRVIKISQVSEFERANGKKGAVVNIWIADNSGAVRIPLWNEQVKIAEELKVNDLVQVTNGITKENIFGDIEISLGKYGSIRILEDSGEILPASELEKMFLTFAPIRSKIKDIKTGNFEILATIVYVFKGSFLFDENGKKSLVISCIADDGTSDLRVVFFRELAEKVCGMKAEDLLKLNEKERYEVVQEKLLGREMVIRGKVRKNKISKKLEMIAIEAEDLNLAEESKKLAEKVEELLQRTTSGGK
jgi:replication factor A1